MKDKIIFLIIGILIGAIITASCFMLFGKNNGPQGRMEGEPPSGNFAGGGRGNKDDMQDTNTISDNNVI